MGHLIWRDNSNVQRQRGICISSVNAMQILVTNGHHCCNLSCSSLVIVRLGATARGRTSLLTRCPLPRWYGGFAIAALKWVG